MNEVMVARYAASQNRTYLELLELPCGALTYIADFHEPIDGDEWPPSGDFSPFPTAPWWRGVWATPQPKPYVPEVEFANSPFMPRQK